MGRPIDLTGKRFGRLTVEYRDTNPRRWICTCDCGKTVSVRADHLKDGHVRSCGCLSSESSKARMETHGMSKMKIYKVWTGMKQRCFNPKASEYERYGGRGIAVCDEWKDDFQNFYEWAIKSGYSEGLSIDRINNNKGYSPDNCQWATNYQQSRNTSRTKIIKIGGKKVALKDFCNMVGAPYNMVVRRLLRGWELYDAITVPAMNGGRR